jgi:glutamate-1-semialdehyde 2,1-aminomutase
LSGNPVAMAAGLAQLEVCAQEYFYAKQEAKTKFMVSQLNEHANAHNYPVEIVSIGSIFWFSFNGHKKIQAASQINPDMSKFNELHHFLLNEGVYFGPSGYEVGFISEAHQVSDLEFAIEKIKLGFDAIYGEN